MLLNLPVRSEMERRRTEEQRRRLEEHGDEIRENCRTLKGYIAEAWHVLEPAREFVHGWHLDCIADHLEAVTAKHINRVLFNVPPGTMKSLEVGVFWPTFEWGPKNLPYLRTLAASYKESLAKRDNIKSRRLIQSHWFQTLWGDQFTLMADQNSTLKYENDKTGFRMAMPFGSVTGERGDRVVIDDPLSVKGAKSEADLKSAEETLLEAIPNRLTDPDSSAIIMVMQRLNEKDPSGVVLAKDMGYVHVMLPMEFEPKRRCYTVVHPTHFNAGPPIIARYDAQKQVWYPEGATVPRIRQEYVAKAKPQLVFNQDPRTQDGELLFPARFSRETVERDKVSLAEMGHAGQNQQRPAPREGGMFKKAWFVGKIIPAAPEGCTWVRHWDLAATALATAARTAGVKIGRTPEGAFVVGHVDKVQAEGHEVRKLIKATAETDGVEVAISLPQDPGQAGKVQKKDLIAMLAGWNVHAEPETGDKETRAEPFAAQCAGGNVYLVKGEWNDSYLDELCNFPGGTFKDQVDASSGAFGRLCARPAREPRVW